MTKEQRRNNWVRKHMERFNKPKTHKPKRGKGSYDRKKQKWTEDLCYVA